MHLSSGVKTTRNGSGNRNYEKTRRDMDPFLNKFLSWLIVFSVIVSLIFLCVVLIDLNNIWKDLIEYQERIKNLEILTLRKMGVKI